MITAIRGLFRPKHVILAVWQMAAVSPSPPIRGHSLKWERVLVLHESTFISPLLMLLDSIKGITKVGGGALYTLWTKYGKWESEGPALFEKCAVVRETGDRQASAGVDVPTSCFVLKLSEEDRSHYGFAVSGILIRDDYCQALDDICYFATHKSLPPQHDAGSASGEFRNPFFNTELSIKTAGVSLIGHPGIGKSLWQLVVLVLRILAGHPTIYHFQSQICYIFNADGLYEVDIQDSGLESERGRFHQAISSQYWCLVDCNQTVLNVPPFLSRLRAFLVQSASPRSNRFDWRKKYEYYSIEYYMKHWSLSELFMGRVLQTESEPCSEADLEIFFSRYAPSARMAYVFAYKNRLLDYERMVKKEINKLTFSELTAMLSAAIDLGTEGVSHHILLVSPGDDRRTNTITIPTRHIYVMLRDHIQIHTLQEAARLYQIFVRNSETKAAAGYIFEDVHDLFCKGGEWKVTQMSMNKAGSVNTHFKSPRSKTKPSYIHLGYHGDPVTFSDKNLPHTAEFAPLAHHRYLLGQNIFLENGYYQPAPGQPTFDSFIYDAVNEAAIMLQMTVATKHNVKAQGVEWLRRQGVRKFYLVAVIPPDTSLDLPIPNTLTPLIKKAYALVLESVLG